MTVINQYKQKQKLIQQLQQELQALENNHKLKEALQFRAAIDNVLQEHGKTVAELMEIFAPDQPEQGTAGKRRKRTPATYRNPITGEEIVVRGGRQKDYQAWIAEHGKETVQGWKL